MQRLYSGFDGLDVSFQGIVGAPFRSALARAKKQAQETKRATVVKWGGVVFTVGESGASGKTYQLDTGHDGEKWFIADTSNYEGWNISVSVKSTALALYGFEFVRDRMFERLEAFDAYVVDHSVGRIDFCVDILAPGFVLNPELVSCHPHATVQEFADTEIVRKGRRVATVTVGKMPGKQVQIYDKRREAIARRKVHWWEIWGVEKGAEVWRVEVRAGKKALKEIYSVSKLPEVENNLKKILLGIFDGVSLKAPAQTDSNVTRQTEDALWIEARRGIVEGIGSFKPTPIETIAKVTREQKDKELSALMSGLAASWAAVQGLVDPSDVAGSVAAFLKDTIDGNEKQFGAKMDRAALRYAGIVPEGYSGPEAKEK